jgi:PAS domain S-box-containing protein
VPGSRADLTAAVLDSIEALVVVVSPDGLVTRTNRAAERIAGRTSRTLVGRPFASRFTRESDRERVEELLQRVLCGRGRAGCETRLQPREGEERVIAWSFQALRDESGALDCLLATGTDLTERLLADQALRDLDAELRHAQRLEALGRLASGVAHDFHNVLTAVLGLADVLAEDIADRPEARALALEIRGAAEQAALLTRQLTTLARKGGSEARPIDPRREIQHMSDLLARLIGEDIVLDLQLDSGEHQLRCDPGQFTQLVLNLALNARDAMPAGGRLTITSQVVRLSPREASSRGLAEHCLLLTVRDTGVGMDEVTRERVFEPWFTTKGAKGNGIGLATVHHVVRQAGGAIAVESAPGHGTRFLLWFPSITEPTVPVAAQVSTADPCTRGTVLLVEDDAAVRRLMRESLRRQGCNVIEAADGRDALSRAAAHEGAIDLLVTDVIMPGMSGPEVAECLSRDGLVQRVLFVSGYADDAMMRHGITPGSASLLEKPFTPAAFAKRVREALALREGSLSPESSPRS